MSRPWHLPQALARRPAVRRPDRRDACRLRSGDALGAVYIPENFERDLMGRKRPQIVMFYNRQYFTPGNNASSAMSSAIAAATAGLPSPTQQAKTPATTGSLVVEQYVLTNPALNFAQFLMRAILPTTLHIVIAIAAGYAVGSEFSSRNSAAWLRAAGGSPLAALVGKLAPLFAMFVVMLVVEAGIVHGVLGGCPCRGRLGDGRRRRMFAGDRLSVDGSVVPASDTQAGSGSQRNRGLLFTSFWLRRRRLPVVGDEQVFPFLGRAAAAALARFRYCSIRRCEGFPRCVLVEPLVVLAVPAAVLFALSWWRLSAIAHTPPRRVPRPEPVPEAPASAGIGAAMFAREIRRVLHDQSALGLIVLAPLLYGALYPQPYLGQLLRDLPIAVVDQDNTEVSRQFVQALNSDEAISVAVRAGSLARGASCSRNAAGVRHRRSSGGNRAGNPERQPGPYRRLCQFGLFSALQPHIAGNFGFRCRRQRGNRRARGAPGRQPGARRADRDIGGRGGQRASVQPDWRLCQLRRSRRIHIDPAAVSADGHRDPGWRCIRTRRFGGSAPARQLAVGHRPRARPSLPRGAGTGATAGSCCRGSTASPPFAGVLDLVLMAIPFVLSVSFLAQFVSFSFERRENSRPALHRQQPAVAPRGRRYSAG